jgi:hypothetical protein
MHRKRLIHSQVQPPKLALEDDDEVDANEGALESEEDRDGYEDPGPEHDDDRNAVGEERYDENVEKYLVQTQEDEGEEERAEGDYDDDDRASSEPPRPPPPKNWRKPMIIKLVSSSFDES